MSYRGRRERLACLADWRFNASLDHGSVNTLFRESATVAYDTVYYYEQLVDHDDPSKGTFRQRYWHSAEFYEEGKVDASGTVPCVYFAQNAVLPQDSGDCIYPVKVPWILISGSYPGENIPKNRSSDVGAVITYIDVVFFVNTAVSERGSVSEELAYYRFGCLLLCTWRKEWRIGTENRWGIDHALPAWDKCMFSESSCQPPTPAAAVAPLELEPTIPSWVLPDFCSEIKLTDIIKMDRLSGEAVLFHGPTLLKQSCVVEFPDAFPTIPLPNSESINTFYGVWSIGNKGLFFANGKCDPWGKAAVLL
ncbi:hypothetical protein EDD85DRAFT_796930 [Armillaria nabsnona]|nr:hypothetical protein EDD85DRAFT_796930 [Armillaria nabsnona]